MTKSKLIKNLANHYPSMLHKDVEKMTDIILSDIIDALRKDEFGSVEIRNFGTFRVNIQKASIRRNPKTGLKVSVPRKKTIKWKMSKELFKKLNNEKE